MWMRDGPDRYSKRKDFIAGFNEIIKVLLSSSFVITFLHAVKVHEFTSGEKFALSEGEKPYLFLEWKRF